MSSGTTLVLTPNNTAMLWLIQGSHTNNRVVLTTPAGPGCRRAWCPCGGHPAGGGSPLPGERVTHPAGQPPGERRHPGAGQAGGARCAAAAAGPGMGGHARHGAHLVRPPEDRGLQGAGVLGIRDLRVSGCEETLPNMALLRQASMQGPPGEGCKTRLAVCL